MTSDAKIGLLLGLVVIFIIAFVINGLPRFRSAVSSNELTNRMVNPEDDSLAIGQRERRAQDDLVWQGQYEVEPSQDFQDFAQDYSNTNDIGYGQDTYNEYEIPEETEPLTEVAYDNLSQDNIRFTMQLAQDTSVIEDTIIESPAYKEPAYPVEPVAPVKRPEPVKPAKPRIYIVQEGDGSLSNIAKKFYGQVEGNRLVNIKRIYEANRKILKSADEIFVGQELLIPPLPATTSNKEGSGLFSNSLFEKVKSIAGRKEPGRWYVVKEDESLWKIAAEQLGDGSRYVEISKLNADILVDEDKLDPGMRLWLPAR